MMADAIRQKDAVFQRVWTRWGGFAQWYLHPEKVGPVQTRTGQRTGGAGSAVLRPIDPKNP